MGLLTNTGRAPGTFITPPKPPKPPVSAASFTNGKGRAPFGGVTSDGQTATKPAGITQGNGTFITQPKPPGGAVPFVNGKGPAPLGGATSDGQIATKPTDITQGNGTFITPPKPPGGASSFVNGKGPAPLGGVTSDGQTATKPTDGIPASWARNAPMEQTFGPGANQMHMAPPPGGSPGSTKPYQLTGDAAQTFGPGANQRHMAPPPNQGSTGGAPNSGGATTGVGGISPSGPRLVVADGGEKAAQRAREDASRVREAAAREAREKAREEREQATIREWGVDSKTLR